MVHPAHSQQRLVGSRQNFFLFGGAADRPLHVRLASAHPDLSDKDVLNSCGQISLCPRDHQVATFRGCLHRFEADFPASDSIGNCILGLSGKLHRYFFPIAGGSPDSDWHLPLQNHVVGKSTVEGQVGGPCLNQENRKSEEAAEPFHGASVRKGAAGKPSRLYRFITGVAAQP